MRGGGKKVRVHIWLDLDDKEEIMLLFGDTIGFSSAIQSMVKRSLRQIRAKAEAQGRVPREAQISETEE